MTLEKLPLDDWATDAIHIGTVINLTFRDRLRVLIRGRVSVQTVTYTEHRPGRCQTGSRVVVWPIREPKVRGGYSEEATRE